MVVYTTSIPLIPQFYAGKSIFITGSSGFMGKVLVERLLSTCPDIGRLYLLMRPKRDVSPEKRLLHLKQSQVFDIIRQQCPSQLEKLVIIPGDTSLPDLGIELEYQPLLQDISIVFHSAATLKFDEPLKNAVKQNVQSVIRIMELCDAMPRIQAFVYVSTAYSNPELTTVEERVYKPPKPLQEVLSIADNISENILNEITKEYICPKPNTYTFTKALAEVAVVERWNRKYPVAIFRPTIVISSHMHPFPGWIENLNGPSGVMVSYGKGLLHAFRVKMHCRADMMPVDIVIDTLIAAAWEIGTDKPTAVKVYNCSSIENPTTWTDFKRSLTKHTREHPYNNVLWYPCAICVENRFLYKILEFLLQTAPLHIIQYILDRLQVKIKQNLITANQRLQSMNDVLGYFTTKEWTFTNDNVQKLRAKLSNEDREIFNIDVRTVKWNDQYEDFVKGTKKYFMKEKDEELKEAKLHLDR
ncbi:hypothetical protein K1T71_000894 [Dendrolimus kikuchii]|uniref:Uncharacterized protein n=1 Tax=Dendrolimus kikuchii TaxID=765133 RepID=A0ACC1DG42_9NEOP|nr:hypothetical protein K1T71_000894 [Dendrolimus kikuchii]